MFRALAVVTYGSELFHTKVRTMQHNYITANKEEFTKYVSGGLEAHLTNLTELRRCRIEGCI